MDHNARPPAQAEPGTPPPLEAPPPTEPTPAAGTQPTARPRVVIVGAGFAGVAAAKVLRKAKADVYLVDVSNHHTFQPLLYQVATAGLSPGNIATPVRKIFAKDSNITVVMGQVDRVDTASRQLIANNRRYAYDYLIVATGAQTSYFGNDHWAAVAPGLKTLDDAIEIRHRFLLAFESAELESDEASQRAALTFVIVGGGATGVELAGSMAEIARTSIQKDFRRIDTRTARVILIDGNDILLSGYPESLSRHAQRDLEQLGVEIMLNTRVVGVEDGRVEIRTSDGTVSTIAAENIVWAAGVRAEPLASTIGCPVDRGGRALVNKDLSVPGHPEIFVVGDAAAVTNVRTGQPVPGVAPAATQMGQHAGRIIRAHIMGSTARPEFKYLDKGSMATIGRGRAVAQFGKLHITGFPAWVLWGVVHIAFLVDFRSKLLAMIEWIWLYLFYARGVRLITGKSRPQVHTPLGEPVG